MVSPMMVVVRASDACTTDDAAVDDVAFGCCCGVVGQIHDDHHCAQDANILCIRIYAGQSADTPGVMVTTFLSDQEPGRDGRAFATNTNEHSSQAHLCFPRVVAKFCG